MTEKKDANYFPALTGIRAIAAFMVFCTHSNPISIDLLGRTTYNFFREFHTGVTMFFVLSGFLIAFRYYDASKFSFRQYIVNRVARIYPIYFILTSITFLLYAVVKHQTQLHDLYLYLMNISFLKGYFDPLKFTGIQQGWSLTVEETFYFLAPLFFLIIRRSWINLLLLPVICVLIGVACAEIFDPVKFNGFMHPLDFVFNYTFWGRAFEFFIGIALALFLKKQKQVKQTKYITLIGAISSLLLIFIMSTFTGGKYSAGVHHPIGGVINNFFLPLCGIAVLYYGLIKEETLLSKFLSSKLMVLLGKSSYIFYLIHMGFIQLALSKYVHNSLAMFVCINIVSIVLFKFVEDPLNHYIRRKFSKAPAAKDPSIHST